VVRSSRASKVVARLATLVTAGLLLTGTTAAQPISDIQTSLAPTGERLNLVVLQGQRTVNDIRTPTTMMLVIEVRDENYRPLEGATVEFELPVTGPSGSFEGGVRNKKVTTNAQGQAFTAFEPNPEPGRFTIQARATHGTRTGMVTIMQQNRRAQSTTWITRHKTLAIVIAVGAAGAATSAILTTRGGALSPSSKPTVTITSGIPTFGSPQ
jgi:hypothetical protein